MSHEQFLYMPDITRRVKRGPKTIRRMVQRKAFPRPVKINGRNAWTETQYETWVQEIRQASAGTSNKEIVQKG